MRKIIAIFLACTMILLGCAPQKANSVLATSEQTLIPNFTQLSDPELLRYVEDNIYSELVANLNTDEYFVENVRAVYISDEYLEEVAYNSQSNIYFGYTLEELNEQFQGTRYVFTLSADGQTGVEQFEVYDDTYEKVLKNVATGAGVILVCVTVSVVSGGAGAPAISVIFITSAKTAVSIALSSGVLSGVAAGVVEGIETGDFDEALKAGALAGSEAFKWGAISGAISGGVSETITLRGATLSGLTMKEAAFIQKVSGYPIDVIKQFKNMEQYNICQKAGLSPNMISRRMALTRSIDLDYVEELTGKTNLELMLGGKAPIDPTGKKYQLHHIGQKNDSTLAVLTQQEHMSNGNNTIWHEFGGTSGIDRLEFNKIKKQFWKDYGEKALQAMGGF